MWIVPGRKVRFRICIGEISIRINLNIADGCDRGTCMRAVGSLGDKFCDGLDLYRSIVYICMVCVIESYDCSL